MAQGTVVKEEVTAKVTEVSKRGREGSYKEKVVQFNGKDYTVGKNDKDKVKVGREYDFKLTKSEYNDKLYYWANLISEGSNDGGNQSGSNNRKNSGDNDGIDWDGLKALNTVKKVKLAKWLLEQVQGEI